MTEKADFCEIKKTVLGPKNKVVLSIYPLVKKKKPTLLYFADQLQKKVMA